LVVFGCVGDGKSEIKTETKTSMKIPINIDIEMPKVITVSDDEFREYLGEQEKTSAQRLQDENNYREIKPITLTIEQRFDDTKFTISMVNSVLSEIIEEYCKETPVNKVCKIPKGSLELLFDKQIVNELMGFVGRKRISDVDAESLIGKSAYFGSVEFVHHDKNNTYDYSLMMDSTDIENIFFSIEESKPSIKTLKWSEDRHKFFYSSLINNERTTLYYQNIPNSGERAYLTHFIVSEMPFVSNTHIFDLSREHNRTDFLLNIKTIDIDTLYDTQRFYQKHSYLQVSEENGYCSTDFYNRYPELSVDGDNIIQELYYNSTIDMSHQVFDKNGRIEATRYCAPFANANANATAEDLFAPRECDYEDITTWTTDSNNALIFKPFDKLYFREIEITMNYSTEDGYLKDGEYFLLPPKLNISNLTMEDVLKQSVASFVVIDGFSNVTYGFVYDKRYADMYDETVHKKLNEFQIVYAKYNHDLNLSLAKRVKEFEVLSDEVKPDIY
jgi:hypothetical protein